MDACNNSKPQGPEETFKTCFLRDWPHCAGRDRAGEIASTMTTMHTLQEDGARLGLYGLVGLVPEIAGATMATMTTTTTTVSFQNFMFVFAA